MSTYIPESQTNKFQFVQINCQSPDKVSKQLFLCPIPLAIVHHKTINIHRTIDKSYIIAAARFRIVPTNSTIKKLWFENQDKIPQQRRENLSF